MSVLVVRRRLGPVAALRGGLCTAATLNSRRHQASMPPGGRSTYHTHAPPSDSATQMPLSSVFSEDAEGGGVDAFSGGPMSIGTHGVAETAETAKVKNLFHDGVFHRCTLCDEQIGNWQGHVVFVPHQARLGVIERVLTGAVGAPEGAAEHWWSLLQEKREVGTHHRVPGMSSPFSEERRKRMVYLLAWFVEVGVLKHSLKVWNPQLGQFCRDEEFERIEMIGDNIVKCVVTDRLHVAFPPEEGGVSAKLNWIQQCIDSNEGLLKIFDYLQLDKIIGSPLANSKFKSDVVECLFGELQLLLWACAAPGKTLTTEFDAPDLANGGLPVLRGLLEHALFELTDVVLLWAIEGTVRNAMPILRKHFNPALLERGARGVDIPTRRTRKSRGPYKALRATVSGGYFDPDGNATVPSKYNHRPLLSEEPAHSLNTSVVTLRGSQAAAREREQSNLVFGKVVGLADFSRWPRSFVPSEVSPAAELAIRYGVDADSSTTIQQQDYALRTCASAISSLSDAAELHLGQLQEEADAEADAADGSVSVSAELLREFRLQRAMFRRRRQDVSERAEKGLAEVSAALRQQGSVLCRSRRRTAGSLEPASEPVAAVGPSLWAAGASARLAVLRSVACDFSPMRPRLLRAGVPPTIPLLSPAPEAATAGDGEEDGEEEEQATVLPPEVEAGQPITWELRAEPERGSGYDLTARQIRRALPNGMRLGGISCRGIAAPLQQERRRRDLLLSSNSSTGGSPAADASAAPHRGLAMRRLASDLE